MDLTQLASQAAGIERAQKTVLAAPAAAAMVPQGVLFWDGRADTLQDQAIGPLTNPVEMANRTPEDVPRKLLQTKYLDRFKQIFGPAIVANPSLLISEAMFAVGRYQIEDPSFHDFTISRANMITGWKAKPGSRMPKCTGCNCSTTRTRPAARVYGYPIRSAGRAAQSGHSRQ